MKKRVVLLLTGLFIWMSSLFAQDVPVGVIVAFKKGNSQELNRYLGDKVDLIIQNKSTNVDRGTAEGTLSGFFSSPPSITAFKYLYSISNSSKDKSSIYIINL